MLGYEDVNDVNYLKNDSLLQDISEGELCIPACYFPFREHNGQTYNIWVMLCMDGSIGKNTQKSWENHYRYM